MSETITVELTVREAVELTWFIEIALRDLVKCTFSRVAMKDIQCMIRSDISRLKRGDHEIKRWEYKQQGGE